MWSNNVASLKKYRVEFVLFYCVLINEFISFIQLFKYDETKKQLESVCFIDWQVMRYSSPVLDLMYFIFCCTTRELRGRNYTVYLKTYHDSLTEFIKRYNHYYKKKNLKLSLLWIISF